MKKKGHIKQAHARHEISEDGKDVFICLICCMHEKWLYDPWEIPIHLRKHHKIPRKKQIILGWNEKFEKEYLKNRNKPLKYETEDIIDTTPLKKYEKEEKERIKKELEAQRDRW